MTMTGEVRFLRAYYYFNLVRYYGGVPLYLKEVTRQEDAFLPRSTVEETLQRHHCRYVQDAINKLAPPTQFPQSGRGYAGRR